MDFLAFNLRFKRDTISWGEAFAPVVPQQIVCPNPIVVQDSTSTSTWLFLGLSILLNVLCLALILRIPLLRGVVRHVLSTCLSNFRQILFGSLGTREHFGDMTVQYSINRPETVVIEMEGLKEIMDTVQSAPSNSILEMDAQEHDLVVDHGITMQASCSTEPSSTGVTTLPLVLL